jgi:4-amino-4-deoxy-L-arabinose transferase-like glycosyltransferase
MLGPAPLTATEAHRAIAAQQMVQSGEWIVPRLYGRIYLAKPPLHYWLEALLGWMTGSDKPWVYRLPAAMEGAILAALLCAFGTRWFGRIGGLVSGIGYLSLITLWGEDSGADIDASNTLFATLAALILLDLAFGGARRRWPWIIGAGLAMGASFLVKGPASLTILGAVIAWICIDVWRKPAPRRRLGWVCIPLLIGIAIFGAYALGAMHYLRSHGLPLDLSGVREGLEDMHPHGITSGGFAGWLIARLELPPTMFLYALPVSVALAVWMGRRFRAALPAPHRALMAALAASVLISWLICLLSGMHTPRYAFVTLPLLCPLAGAIAANVTRMDQPFQKNARLTLMILACVYWCAILGFTIVLWHEPRSRLLLPMMVVMGALCAWVVVVGLARLPQWDTAWGLVALIVMAAVAYGFWQFSFRLQRNSVAAARELRDQVGGAGTPVYACAIVLDQPELFYFSGVAPRVTADPRDQILYWWNVPAGNWVLLEKPEFEAWRQDLPDRIPAHPIEIRVNKSKRDENVGYLIWFTGAPSWSAQRRAHSAAATRQHHH